MARLSDWKGGHSRIGGRIAPSPRIRHWTMSKHSKMANKHHTHLSWQKTHAMCLDDDDDDNDDSNYMCVSISKCVNQRLPALA